MNKSLKIETLQYSHTISCCFGVQKLNINCLKYWSLAKLAALEYLASMGWAIAFFRSHSR